MNPFSISQRIDVNAIVNRLSTVYAPVRFSIQPLLTGRYILWYWNEDCPTDGVVVDGSILSFVKNDEQVFFDAYEQDLQRRAITKTDTDQ